MTKQKSNKRKLFLIFMVVILGTLIIAGTSVYHNSLQIERPFEDLTTEDVKSISLYSIKGEIIYTFNEEEKAEIVKLLNGIATGKKDNKQYNGGFNRQFRMEKTDGTIIEFGTNANFWIEGQRYEVPENNISLVKLRKLHTEYYKEYYVPLNVQN